jgi:hypothetical protein
MNAFSDVLLNFVRRDGRQEAPVVFLTIEDGGSFTNKEDFLKYYSDPANEVWERTERTPGMKEGMPGLYIAKLMTGLFSGSIAGWADYREQHLYLRNECNIKYRPIARRTTNEWQTFFTNEGGITWTDYLDRCNSPERHEVMLRKNPRAFAPSKLFVILGLRDEWKAFLDARVFAADAARSLEVVKDARGRIVHELFGPATGSLSYCYFNMFRRGNRNADIEAFCESAGKRIRPDLRLQVRIA